MNEATPENWERLARQEDANWNRKFRANLESAIDKLDRKLHGGRMPTLTKDEAKALRTFYSQHI